MKGKTYDAGAAAYDQFTGRWSAAFGSSLLAAAGVTVGQTPVLFMSASWATARGSCRIFATHFVRSSPISVTSQARIL